MMASSAHTPSTPRDNAVEYSTPVEDTSQRKLTPEEFSEFRRQHRLGIPLAARATIGGLSGFIFGAFLGAFHGGQREGLRFRAENAHRQPKSQKNWYLYHKSKNYAAMYGGVKEGARMSLKTSFWVVAFVLFEAAADYNRGGGGQRDFLSTATAGVGTAALWSAWHRFPAATTVRTGKLGLKIGIGYGLVQDLLGYARGREITYIEYGKRMLGVAKKDED